MRVVQIAFNVGAVIGLASVGCSAEEAKKEKPDADGFVKLFDGKTLSGWKIYESPESWSVIEGGIIQGKGNASHLFSPKEYADFEFKADVRINKGGNSGMFFRTQYGPNFPKGYEAQVNASHTDPQRSGSLWSIVPISESFTKDDTWFNQHVICKGNHIVIKIDGKIVVDYVDASNRYKKGRLALQQHDPKSVVLFRNVMVKEL